MDWLKAFFRSPPAVGIILVMSAVLAMVVANSGAQALYREFLDLPVVVSIGPLGVAKPLLLWINDGLMAVFFFLIGLELKREALVGELRGAARIALPGIGALGGMAVPALIYVAVNQGHPTALRGWAIPAATDIAFALGVLALLGQRVPAGLRLLLSSIAVFDDLGAIVIIALFYTSDLSWPALAVVAAVLPLLLLLNRLNVVRFTPYLLLGLVMWTALLKSGVHATLAGVALALFIPMRDRRNPAHSPLDELEHDLKPTVEFGILPLFAFANAGIAFGSLGADAVLHPVSVGVAAGLFLGKQVGVFASCWLAVRAGLAALPSRVDWKAIYGVAILCGIGFTMSLFIGGLAFDDPGARQGFDERIGIMLGSLLSGVVGYVVLRAVLPAPRA